MKPQPVINSVCSRYQFILPTDAEMLALGAKTQNAIFAHNDKYMEDCR